MPRKSVSASTSTSTHRDSSPVQDTDAVMKELRQMVEKDQPVDFFAYVREFAWKRLNVKELSEVEQTYVLCDAAATGNLDSVRSLLETGVDVNGGDYDKRTALHLAAESGHLHVVKLLVSNGADVNCVDRWTATPLSGALRGKHTAVVNYLKGKGGVGVSRTPHTRCTDAALACAAASKGDIEMLKTLKASGTDIKAPDYDHRTALHLAAEEGHLECVKYLISEGFDLNVHDRWGTTPLSGAEQARKDDVASFLRTAGGKLTGELGVLPQLSFRKSPADDLITAAAKGDVAELKRLLAKGANVNKTDYDQRSALHLAAEEGHYEVVKLLIKHKADLNVKDRWGVTPLRGALRNTHNNIADYLKDCGASTDRFMEPVSYSTYCRRARNFFEGMAGSVGFPPKTDILPLSSLKKSLEEYGFDPSKNLILQGELAYLTKTLDSPKIATFLSSNPAIKEFLTTHFQETNEPRNVFTWQDFSDVVLNTLSEYQEDEGGVPPNTYSLISDAVLDRLVIGNWEAFVSNLDAIYEEVLATPNDGACADYIPELRDADPNRFAVSICTVNGQTYNLGDAASTFSVQSVGKTFAYTMALKEYGSEWVHRHVGQEPSGRAFNDFTLTRKGNPFNPVTNAGAIVTCSMLNPNDVDTNKRLMPYKEFLSEIAGGMEVGDCMDVYHSEQGCAFRNYALANFMKSKGTFPEFVDCIEKLEAAVEFYLRVCSCRVSTPLLAAAAATYANHGRSPLSGKDLITDTEVKQTLHILSSCGMYDYSGEWACTIGMPAKSGVSGEIFVVVPAVSLPTAPPRRQ
eukprot:TRINITY_DN3017_c0_g1_i2.p1 TRINITY_DN3017_c0_g1~~TRINITY_DN3017_c0_g1_i2.p1  ORF type:complete len:802 (+),score=150.98 TRINITY_DN3017_c0_g1_i2:38-2443(+)